MTDKKHKWLTLPLVGGLSFWFPDTVLHLVRNVRFDDSDVWIATISMLFCLFVAWIAASKTLRRSPSAIAPQFLLGIWVTGGLFMSLGWMLSTPNPLRSLAISSLLGIIPIHTFMAATYDGSLLALLLVSAVLIPTWIVRWVLRKRSDRLSSAMRTY